MSDDGIVDNIIKKLDILAMSVAGCKFNKYSQLWETQGMFTGISRMLRGDSRADILVLLKSLAEEMVHIKDKETIQMLKSKVKSALDGMDNICQTYQDEPVFVTQIKRYSLLLKEYFMAA